MVENSVSYDPDSRAQSYILANPISSPGAFVLTPAL